MPWLIGGVAFALVAGAAGFILGGARSERDQALASGAESPVAVAASAGESGQRAVASAGESGQRAVASAGAAPSEPDIAAPGSIMATPCPASMVLVQGGKFFMGSDRDVPVLTPARPAHQVEVGAYCIDVHEVTVDEYRACSDKGECKRAHRDSEWPRPASSDEAAFKAALETYSQLCNEAYEDRGDHPINCVTWDQARRYCEWDGGRLPTEAEWEFAARGSDGRIYPWGDDVPDPERMNGCGAECRTWRAARGLPETPAVLYPASDRFPGTAPVGSFPGGRTQWGLEDIAGNVFEWTADAFAPYPGAPKQEPVDDETARRVIRGGAFNSFLPDHADPALRFAQAEQAHTHGIGFRCASAPREASG